MSEPKHHDAQRRNLEFWDEVAPIHAKAYETVRILRAGGDGMRQLEIDEIGDVSGKTLLHLQCHIGTDTLSWARRGAIVTGVDFSTASLRCAEDLRDELGLDARFVHSNIYHLREQLDGRFDVVYTSAGVLCWLHDLREWARIVAHFLQPGGVFYLLDSQPRCNTRDDTTSGPPEIVRHYFHRDQPTRWEPDGTPDYADSEYLAQATTFEWHWTLSDIVNSLIAAGLVIDRTVAFHPEPPESAQRGGPCGGRCLHPAERRSPESTASRSPPRRSQQGDRAVPVP